MSILETSSSQEDTDNFKSSEENLLFTKNNIILVGASVALSSFLTAIVFFISVPLNTKAVVKTFPIIKTVDSMGLELAEILKHLKTLESSLQKIDVLEKNLKTYEAKLIIFKGHIYQLFNSLENRIHKQSFPVISKVPSASNKKIGNLEQALIILRRDINFIDWPTLKDLLKNYSFLEIQLEKTDSFLQEKLPSPHIVLKELIQNLKMAQKTNFKSDSIQTERKTIFQKVKFYLKNLFRIQPTSVKNDEIDQLISKLETFNKIDFSLIHYILFPHRNNDIVAPAYKIFERYIEFNNLLTNLEKSIHDTLLSSFNAETIND